MGRRETLTSEIAALLRARDGFEPHIDRDVFGAPDPATIFDAVDGFCRHELGAAVAAYEFLVSSISSVHGVRLSDDRRVVIKVHRASEDSPRMHAVQEIQAGLAECGFPAPLPLVGPRPLARGLATAEQHLSDGRQVDAHSPQARLMVAAGLAELIRECRGIADTGVVDLLRPNRRGDELWPEPHDRRFDFTGTSIGAEWIDEIARSARMTMDELKVGDVVIGHDDWRVEHLRFTGSSLSAVYDWDSLTAEREPIIVGSAAHAFTADWTRSEINPVPTHVESLAFIADYEQGRGTPFTATERQLAQAALTYSTAYGARCEHSDLCTDYGRSAPSTSPSPP